MNTKSSEISSGLVAVAEVGSGFSIRWTEPDYGGSCKPYDMLVRLSDAEAIISKLSSKERYGVCDECWTPYSFDPTDGGTICVKCQNDKIAQKDAEIERLKHKPTIEDADTTVDHLLAYAADNGYSHGDYADVMSEAASQIEQQAELIKELESDVDEEAHIRDRMAKLLAETAVALKGPEKALHRHGWQDLPDVAAKQSAALKLAREALGTLSLYVAYNGDDWVKRNATEALAAINEVLKGE